MRSAPPVRVAPVGPEFWVLKALSTAMGESVSDFFVHTINPVAAVLVGFVTFLAAMAVQLTQRRYRPASYWLAVAMVGVFGTMAADVMHVAVGLPYAATVALFVVALGTVFVGWALVDGCLAVHAVTSRRRELFYWSAVIGTFALGTALGDCAADVAGIGYLASALAFAGLLGLVALVAMRHWVGPVLGFWAAYVLTRPVGASAADWLGKPDVAGGLGLGAGVVGGVLALAMVLLVGRRVVLEGSAHGRGVATEPTADL